MPLPLERKIIQLCNFSKRFSGKIEKLITVDARDLNIVILAIEEERENYKISSILLDLSRGAKTIRIQSRSRSTKRIKRSNLFKGRALGAKVSELPSVYFVERACPSTRPRTYRDRSFFIDGPWAGFLSLRTFAGGPSSFQERTINSRGHWYAIDASGFPTPTSFLFPAWPFSAASLRARG